MKKNLLFFILLLTISVNSYGQSFSGPAFGIIDSGLVISTESFSKVEEPEPWQKPVRNKISYDFLPDNLQSNFNPNGLRSEIVYDKSLLKSSDKPFVEEEPSILFKNFNGISETNSIPPDPYIAVGKNHVITTVNTSFRISDKEGNTIFTTSADRFLRPLFNDVSAFDPKVIYDHFNNRWVMVWLHQDDNQKIGYYIVSVSDDDDPMGNWYNWLLPSNMNGSDVVDNWGDYQGVGYDKDNIYITSNNFSFGGSYNYVKIRAISNTELYANNAGAIQYVDFWNIKDPSGNNIFGIRPSRFYDENDEYYFVQRSPYSTGDHMLIYKLKDPFGDYEFTATKVTVGEYRNPNNAKQLGGGAIDIEGGSGNIRNEPVYRNGVLHFVHSVSSGTGRGAYSSLRYLAINPKTSEVLEDQVIGNIDGYYHFYPALAVDKDDNVVITYSRSAETEYAGAYYITKKATDSTFSGSKVLEAGKGNYVKDFGSGRNRWGDYNGIWLDPVDENNFWMITEYAANTNTWGVKIGALRLIPFTGVYASILDTAFTYAEAEVGKANQVKKIILNNYGNEDLIVSSLKFNTNNFKIEGNVTLPLSIATYDSLVLNVAFSPEETGDLTDILEIQTNDPDDNIIKISFKGSAFELNSVTENDLYIVSKALTGSELNTFNRNDLSSNVIGEIDLNPFQDISINLKEATLYGLYSISSATGLVKINATGGDAHYQVNIDLPLKSIAFNNNGTLYGTTADGLLYEINKDDGSFGFIDSLGFSVSAMTINYANNDIYLAAGSNAERGKGALYKIDPNIGDTVFIGLSGLNVPFNSIVVDPSGDLLGVTGSLFSVADMYSINPETGAAELLGSTGLKGVKGLAFAPTGLTKVNDEFVSKPAEFRLMQNYPNPFNPSTTIEFALPSASKVKLSIYNLIGQEIQTLADNNFNAGVHSVVWNSTDRSGSKVSSGIYFYRIKAVDNNGKEFSSTKKLILLK